MFAARFLVHQSLYSVDVLPFSYHENFETKVLVSAAEVAAAVSLLRSGRPGATVNATTGAVAAGAAKIEAVVEAVVEVVEVVIFKLEFKIKVFCAKSTSNLI